MPFDVFISYSRTDVRLARSLHRALERVDVPADGAIAGPRLTVFRDETDIRGTRYYDSIDDTLRASGKLLVVCSPAARRSDYVNDEIKRFLGHHALTDVIPVIASGLPNNATTSEAMKAFPDILGDMPLAADLTSFEPRRNRLQDREWEPAWHLILANVLDLPRSSLDERAARIRDEAGRAEALRLLDVAGIRALQGRRGEALLHMATAHAVAPVSPLRTSLHLATIDALPEFVVDGVVMLPVRPVACNFSADGSTAITWGGDNVARMIDSTSGEVLAEHAHPDVLMRGTFLADGRAATFSRSGRIAVLRRNGDSVAWDAPGPVWDLHMYPGDGVFASIGLNGRVCLWSPDGDGPIIVADELAQRELGNVPKATFSADPGALLITDGSTIIAVDSGGHGAIATLPGTLTVHEARHDLGVFLVSDDARIHLLSMDPESAEASLATLATGDAPVKAATIGPGFERLAYLDRAGNLVMRPALPAPSGAHEAGDSAEEPPARVVQPPPDVESLAWWNGDAVVVAYGRTSGAAFGASTGDVLWTRSFDREAGVGGGVAVHASSALLSHVDLRASQLTLIDLATGLDVDSGQSVVRPVRGVASAADRPGLALVTGEPVIRVLGRRQRRAATPLRRYHDVANVIDRGDRVLLGYERDDVGYVVLDAVSGDMAFPPLNAAVSFSSVVLSPMGFTLSTIGRQDGALRVWRADRAGAAEVTLPAGLRAPDLRTSVSEHGRTLVVSGQGRIVVLDLEDASTPQAHMAHPSGEGFARLQLGPRDERLASLSTANEVQLWNVADGQPIGDAARFDGPVLGLGFIAEGQWLLAWSSDSALVVIDTSSGAMLRMIHPDVGGFMENGINDVKASSDGALLFSGGQDGTLRTWDRETGEQIAEPVRHSYPLRGLAPSDDAERILTFGGDTVTVWHPWTGSKAGPDILQDELIAAAFWTLDNVHAAVSDGASIRLFDPETALAIAGPWHHRGASLQARFVDDVLVTWATTGAAAVWELDVTGQVDDWRPLAERVTGHALDVDQRTVESLSHDEHTSLAGVARSETFASVYGGRCVPRDHALSGFPSGRPLAVEAMRALVIEEGWFDADLNPVGRAAEFEVDGNEDAPSAAQRVVGQPARRLMWQAGGSGLVDLDGLADYVRTTRAAAFGGYDDWRLPRVFEAITTVSPILGEGRLHAAAGFEGAQTRIWTWDTTDDGRLWIVDYVSGRALQGTPADLHHVRLVRDVETTVE